MSPVKQELGKASLGHYNSTGIEILQTIPFKLMCSIQWHFNTLPSSTFLFMFLKPTVLPVLLPRSSKSQSILLTGWALQALNYACSNPDPLLLWTTRPQVPTLTQDSFLHCGKLTVLHSPGLWSPFCPPSMGVQQFAVSLRVSCDSQLHNPYHWHTSPWMTTDPILHVDLPVFPSLNLRCREKEAFQCFNLSKQYFQKDCWVKNYVKMIIQVSAPIASIKDQTNWKSLLLPWNPLFK